MTNMTTTDLIRNTAPKGFTPTDFRLLSIDGEPQDVAVILSTRKVAGRNEWATHTMSLDTGSWVQGRYFDSQPEAWDSLIERSAR